jgi:hypothetical protein
MRIEPIDTYNYFEPRTADFSDRMAFAKNFRINGFISSDYRKTLAIDARYNYRWFADDRREINIRFSPRVRFSDKLFMILSSNYSHRKLEPGFVNRNLVNELQGVAEGRILFGRRDRDQVESILNLNYIFNDKMSLTTRVRHYWDRVIYSSFGWLNEAGYQDAISLSPTEASDDPLFDRNINQFNIDMVYTWRFAPGSDIVFVWKNAISGSDNNFNDDYWQNLSGLSNGNQFDSFSLKVIYFLDYLYFKK